MNNKSYEVTKSGTRVLIAPKLKDAHSLWKNGKLNTGEWCNILQFYAYGFPLSSHLVEFGDK